MSEALVQEQKRLGPNRVTILLALTATAFYFENPQSTANDKAKVKDFIAFHRIIRTRSHANVISI